MSVFRIEGGHPLTGTVRTQGAKNSVLPILAATLLSPGESVIHNCPRLTDVEYTLEILRRLGCRAEREGETVTVSAAAPTEWEIPDDLMREMRSSVIFLGALLARGQKGSGQNGQGAVFGSLHPQLPPEGPPATDLIKTHGIASVFWLDSGYPMPTGVIWSAGSP